MKKIISIFLLIFLSMPKIFAYEDFSKDIEKLNIDSNICKNIKQTDIPTIFIPGILASWYSEQGLGKYYSKNWIPDPMTHVYDTLFKVFQEEGKYRLEYVSYDNEFEIYIVGNPKQTLYLFGYDWKKDNKITAKLLRDLILKIRLKYEEENGCDIGKVNILAHSMGGLVARSMLENICASDYDIKNYYKNIKKGKIKRISSSPCYNYTKINKFITISTPQRGAPSSFALWETGDLELTTGNAQSFGLRTQLGTYTNESLYEMIHGYNDKIPNGIVTIGQLLPDIKKNNKSNEKLKYLYKNNEILDNYNHPQNSFLEELNKKENIDKMFDVISGKYIMYYSKQTGSDDKNNVIGYNIKDKYSTRLYGMKLTNKTEKYKGKNIYDKYKEIYGIGGLEINRDHYNINDIIRNDTGLGGDGTVATNNLILSNNDNEKEIQNDKLKVIKVSCFDNNNLDKENDLSYMLGKNKGELCSHTIMPITTSLNVYNEIVNNSNIDSNSILNYSKEDIKKLYSYIGYVNYNLGKDVNDLFSNNFNKQFISLDSINNFIENRYNKDFKNRLSLNLGSPALGIFRYEILSPINIIIEDEKGRKIGIDPETGMIINEIPGAWTSGNTEGNNEPEFFLIPKTGSGFTNHKIISNPTGNGEYHIVIQDLQKDKNGILQEKEKLIIAGEARLGIDEKYEVNISSEGGSFIKIDSDIEEKYKDLLEKIYFVLDNKYNDKKKEKLKNNLEKVIISGNKENKYTDKVFYLVGKIFNYLNK